MIKNNIFHFTFALAAALMSSSVAVSATSSKSDTDFDRGFIQGKKKAQNIWRCKEGSNCAYISDFEDQVNDYIQTHYWYHSNDHYSEIWFDKGAQAGMKQVLQKYQTQCQNDHNDDNVDVEMCSGMGKDAASEIAEEYAMKYCGFSMLISNQKKKYKKECLSIGKDDCKGAINDKIFKYCHKYVDNSYVLKGLKGQCRSKVKEYIDYSLD